MGRDDDKDGLYKTSCLEFLEHEACHDGLAKPRIVGQEETYLGLGKDMSIDRLYLMGEKIHLGDADSIVRIKSVSQTHPQGIGKGEALLIGKDAFVKLKDISEGRERLKAFCGFLRDENEGRCLFCVL